MEITLESLVEDIRPGLTEAVKKKMTEGLAESMSWGLRDQIQKIVENYVAEHVVPAVQAKLQEEHEAIVARIVKGVVGSADLLALEMAKKLAEGIGRSGTLKDIFERILRGY